MPNSTANKKMKILVVEDHPLFRAMLVHLIEKEMHMMVCGESDNIKDAMAMIEKTRPDAAIVDITLNGSSGLELIKDVKTRNIPLPVLVISMHEEKLYAERVLRAGGKGYISKQERPSEVITALNKVIGGGIYLSGRITDSLLNTLGNPNAAMVESKTSLLSDRELEVFQLIGRGLNAREISEQIHLGLTTVDSYRQRIKEKLGLKNAAALYQHAAQWLTERSL